METQKSKNLWHAESSSKREVYSGAGLSQEISKTSNKVPNQSLFNKLEKDEQSQVIRRKEIMKIREK